MPEWELAIKSITLHPFALPLVRRFETSFGSQSLKAGALVRLETVDGVVGWGEVVATWDAGYSYETVPTALHILQDWLIPCLMAVQPLRHDSDSAWLDGVRGHPMAKHGLISAILSAAATQTNLSMADFIQQLAGAESHRERVKVGVSIGIEPSIDQTLETIQGYVDEGYGRVKLKIKPKWDIELLRAVRAAFPDLLLMADANSAYTLEDVALFKQMDDLNLLMIEQPLDEEDIYHHSRLQAQLATPICLDESLHTLGHVELAHHLKACRIVNLKPQRVGGIWEAVKIHNFCQEVGLGLWIGGMLETGAGRAMSVALAALPHVTLPSDLSATKRYYQPDLAEPYFDLNSDSTLTVPKEIGLGVTVNERQLALAENAYQVEAKRLWKH